MKQFEPYLAIANLSRWDRFKLFFRSTEIMHVPEEWVWVYYKNYKGEKIIVHVEKQH